MKQPRKERKYPATVRDHGDGFTVSFKNAYLDGAMANEEGREVAWIKDLTVPDGQANQGLGGYVVRAFLEEVTSRGAEQAHAYITNPKVARAFGRYDPQFYDIREGERIDLPMTPKQAAASVERASDCADTWDDQGVSWPDDFAPSLYVSFDLTNPKIQRIFSQEV